MLPRAVAVVAVVAVAAAQPSQIHISMDNTDLASVVVTWASTHVPAWNVTLSSSADLSGPNTITVPGDNEGAYKYSIVNASSQDCYSYVSPTFFSAVAGPKDASWIKPGATVHYKISADGVPPSDTFSFVLPPTASGQATVKLAVIGDLGQTANSTNTVQHVLAGTHAPGGKRSYDAVVIAGDLSYADAENLGRCTHDGGCVPTRWDSYGEMYQQLGAYIPTFTTPGNHEIELVSVGERADALEAGCNVTDIPFLEYRARWFRFRTTSPAALHYSYNIGNVHAVMINSYARYVDTNWNTQESEQYKWLEADLAAVDRATTPWIAVFLHAPWYNSNSHHRDEDEETQIQALFEPLLHKYQIDVIFAGHVHAYERTLQVLDGKVATTPSFIEINVGDGGNREGPAVPWCEPVSLFPWSAYRDAVFGHGSFETFNSTHARWSWIRNNESEFDTPGDDVWLVKGHAAHAGGVRVYDAAARSAALGAEWTVGRQHEFVDKYGIARRWGRDESSCPSGRRV